MPRRPRRELAGAIHHVTQRGNRRQPLFRDDLDRSAFLFRMQVVARAHEWNWLSYCLMGNHVHLVVETRACTLGKGMHRLAGRYAQTFNRRYGLDGHLYQDRFDSKLVTTDAYLLQCLRYVARNPVRHRACDDPLVWPWSSHRALLDPNEPTIVARRRVESLLEVWGGTAGSRYARIFDPADELAEVAARPGPWTEPPPLDELFAGMPTTEAIREARRHRYTIAAISAACGLSESTVRRRSSE